MHGSTQRRRRTPGEDAAARRPADRHPVRANGSSEDDLRASDAERSASADVLRSHAVAGRLDVDELDERVALALSARMRAELRALTADLPPLAAPGPGPESADAAHEGTPTWGPYLAVMALLVAIWMLTGAGHPWPLYPALGWGIPLLLATRAAGDDARRLEPTT